MQQRAPNFDHVKSQFRLHLLSKGFGRKAAGRLVSFVRFPSHAAAHPFDLLLVRVNGRMRGYMNGGRLPHQLLITPLNIRFTSIAHGFRFLSASLTCMQPPSTKPAAASRSSTHPAMMILDTLSHLAIFAQSICLSVLELNFGSIFHNLHTVGVCSSALLPPVQYLALDITNRMSSHNNVVAP